MFKEVLFVGLGGMLGSILRYIIFLSSSKFIGNFLFPYSTLFINLAGCFGIGFFYALLQRYNLTSSNLKLFLLTGLFGGFTTFSAFGFETVSLLKDGYFLLAINYVLLSVIIGIGFTYLSIRAF